MNLHSDDRQNQADNYSISPEEATLFFQCLTSVLFKMDANKAARFVKEHGQGDGTFIFRQSSSTSGFALTFVHHHRCLHEKIAVMGNGGAVGMCGIVRKSVMAIIQYYQMNNIGRTTTRLTRISPTIRTITTDVLRNINPNFVMDERTVVGFAHVTELVAVAEQLVLNLSLFAPGLDLVMNNLPMSVVDFVNLFLGSKLHER